MHVPPQQPPHNVVLWSVAMQRVYSVEPLIKETSSAAVNGIPTSGLETVLPTSLDAPVAAACAMSDRAPYMDFDKIVRKEVDDFNKAVENFKRDGSLPFECCFTEVSRRLNLIRSVGQNQNVYHVWRTISVLVETWNDRDMWEGCVKNELRGALSSTSTATGGGSSRVFMLAV